MQYNNEFKCIYVNELSISEVAEFTMEQLDTINQSLHILQSLMMQHAYNIADALEEAQGNMLPDPEKPTLFINIKLLKSGFVAQWFWKFDLAASLRPGRPKKFTFSQLPKNSFSYRKNDFSVFPSPEKELLIAAEAEFSNLRRQFHAVAETRRILARFRSRIRSKVYLQIPDSNS